MSSGNKQSGSTAHLENVPLIPEASMDVRALPLSVSAVLSEYNVPGFRCLPAYILRHWSEDKAGCALGLWRECRLTAHSY